MIDTCQANTLYSRFYSPNIIATGSSALDQSSYSHHADNDVGVAVIDRYTYYNLEFLETHVPNRASQRTLGDLFDSYDERLIHSQPGIRWDLFEGGEERGRQRLVMDFFGNVQGVEIEKAAADTKWNETEWKEDLKRLWELSRRKAPDPHANREPSMNSDEGGVQVLNNTKGDKRQGAAKVEAAKGWGQQVMGAWTLMGCALVWLGASWLESPK